ncbi:hypothetical protein SADUNF_Sadunf17G0022600 [Salix dunnii]|uniref:Ubiquitin-like domain-containing protein n=1 Tax=Salix dunnii TaxID=1413687 RepID=A0A835J9J4_9ROSI|nr:hypothetical protein SADUNF_Sadunf17G0022600 [Salix dunnii]
MKVIVLAGARDFLLKIGVQDSVLDIKRRIQQLVGVPVAAQILAVSGWELIDGLDMEDYPSRQINIEVDRTDTVRSLKEKIHLFDGTTIKRMSLSFLGWNLMKIFATSVYKCS